MPDLPKSKPPQPQPIDPITISMKEAMRLSGLGRTFLTKEMNLKKFPSFKKGGRRLILLAGFRQYLSGRDLQV